jgi:hypothetical protein
MKRALAISAARAALLEVDGTRRALSARGPEAPEAVAALAARGEPSVDWFPGRWDPRRRLPEEVAPLIDVAAAALERGGWWRRGSGEACAGALVAGCDGLALESHRAFVRELRADPAAVGPGKFLFALPSTPASVLGILFGLGDYQATAAQGAESGLQALRHGLDLLDCGRLERVLVAALSVAPLGANELRVARRVSVVRVAAALAITALDPEAPAVPGRATVVEGDGDAGPSAGRGDRLLTAEAFCDEMPGDSPRPARLPGAAPLWALAGWLESGSGESAVVASAGRGGAARIRLTRKGR